MQSGQSGQSGRLFVLSAPSGAGKTSLARALSNSLPDLEISVSLTTRDRRSDEQHGSDYYFVSMAEFLDMQTQGLFIESALVFGNHYATSRTVMDRVIEQGHHLILEIDWQGAEQIRAAVPEAITIFILPPSLQALRKRLMKRARDDRETIEHRMAEAMDEMLHYKDFEYLVINDDFDQALADLTNIVQQRDDLLRLEHQKQHNQQLLTELRLIDGNP